VPIGGHAPSFLSRSLAKTPVTSATRQTELFAPALAGFTLAD
jgi:hypothetical protein